VGVAKGGERGHVPSGWRDNKKNGRAFVPERLSSRSKVELGVLDLDNLICQSPSAQGVSALSVGYDLEVVLIG
jgi:hypothetical protein